MRPTTKKLLALSAAVSLGLAACGEDELQPAVSGEAVAVEEPTTTTEATTATADDASADDPASTLRATLTSLLQEHAYLTGIAVEHVVEGGADDPTATGALDALEQNTVAIGEAIGLVPGADDTSDFLDVWRDHIGSFVDYAAGRAADDDTAVDEARSGLERYQQETADMLESLTDGELLADELFGELEAHVTMVTGFVDTLLGKGEAEVGPVQQLRDAGNHMTALASTLVEGITAAHEDAFAGDPGSVPAETRAGLAADLQQHTYLTLMAAQRMAETGSRSAPEVQEVVSLVLSSGEGLANVVAGAVGNDARSAFLAPWRAHTDALLAYAQASTTGGDTGAARAALDGTASGVAEAMAGAAGGVDLAADVMAHVDALVTATDAIAAGDPAAWSLGRAAAQVGPRLAAALAPALNAASAAPDAAEGQGAEGGGDTGEEGGDTGGDTGGGAPEGSSDGGGASTGGTAEGGATGEGEGSPTEDEEPPGSPAEAGGPAAEGEAG